MQKSCLPLLISATVCGTLLAVDVSWSGNMDYSTGSSHGAGNPGYNTAAQFRATGARSWLSPTADGFAFSVVMESLDNDYTTANNRTTGALALGDGFTFGNPMGDTGLQPAAFYGASVSHSTYDEALPDANTFTAKMSLAIPFGGAGAGTSAASATTAADHYASLDISASTADNFLDAGPTHNATMSVGYSMTVMDGLSIGAGIKAGRTATEKGGNTDTVGVNSLDYSEINAGVKYVSGDLTFNANYTRTNTSEAVGAESTDIVYATAASVSYYAFASGVTAILGWTNNDTENGVQTSEGSTWYIGSRFVF